MKNNIWYDDDVSKQINIPDNNYQLSTNDMIYKDVQLYEFNDTAKHTQPKTIIKRLNYKIYPSEKQIKILTDWFAEIQKIYKICIKVYNNNDIFNNSAYEVVKIIMDIYNNFNTNTKIRTPEYVPIPMDILKNTIRVSYSIYCPKKSMHPGRCSLIKKERDIEKRLFISSNEIDENGVYTQYLGNMKGFEQIQTNNIIHNIKISHKKTADNKEYIFSAQFKINDEFIDSHIDQLEAMTEVPHINSLNISNAIKREPIVAIDPGENVFITYYGINDFGKIGDNIKQTILQKTNQIKKIENIIRIGKNKCGEYLINSAKKKLYGKIKKINRKIDNIITDLHNKASLFLCKNYDIIMIPKMKTYINSSDILKLLRHDDFLQHLIVKARIYHCHVKIVTEEHTTKTCTNCGKESNTYNFRLKICKDCGYQIDRDINGARNILIKNLNIMY